MNIKNKIWLLPGIAIAISSASIATNYLLSRAASQALNDAGQVHYPVLNDYQILIPSLNGIQENLTNAVSASDKNALGLADEKAAAFRATLTTLSQIPEQTLNATTAKTQFAAYYDAATESAAIMLGVKKGDVAPVIQRMQGARESLQKTLTASRDAAAEQFNVDLKTGQADVQNALYVSVAGALITFLGLGGVSFLVITSITTNLKAILDRVKDTPGGKADLTKQIEIVSHDEFRGGPIC